MFSSFNFHGGACAHTQTLIFRRLYPSLHARVRGTSAVILFFARIQFLCGNGKSGKGKARKMGNGKGTAHKSLEPRTRFSQFAMYDLDSRSGDTAPKQMQWLTDSIYTAKGGWAMG